MASGGNGHDALMVPAFGQPVERCGGIEPKWNLPPAALLHQLADPGIAQTLLTVEIGYPDEARVRRWIEQEGYALADSGYEMEVRLTIGMPVTALDAAREALRDMTQGRAVLHDAP